MPQNIVHIFGFLALALAGIPVWASLFAAQIVPRTGLTLALAAAFPALCVIVALALFRRGAARR